MNKTTRSLSIQPGLARLAAMLFAVAALSACNRPEAGARPSAPPAGSNQSASSPTSVVQPPPTATNSEGGAVPSASAAGR